MDKKRRKLMFDKAYPMEKLFWCERAHVTDNYVSYWLVLEQKAEFMFCFDWRLENVKEASCYNVTNQVLFYAYAIVVPLIQIIEYILQEVDGIEVGGFNLLIITRSIIVIATLFALVFVASFSRSFRSIIPFEPFLQQFMSISVIQTGYNIIGAIWRFTQTSAGEYNATETYTLLFIVVFSCLFAVMLLFPTILINPDNILKIETKKQIRVATRTYTEESIRSSGKSSVNKSSINAGDTTQHGLKKMESVPNKPLKPSLKKAVKDEVSGSENIDVSVVEPNKSLFVHGNIKQG
jgi:hypothetical protein